MYEPKATHTFDNEDEVTVGETTEYGTNHLFVFDGPNGLEVVIPFDFVTEERNTIEFYRTNPIRKTGRIGGSFEYFGEVGDYFEGFQGPNW
jgi:hypothetical protein